MSADKAREIINQAMANRSVDAMAARENEVWSKILPERERSEARIDDAEASAKPGVARHASFLLRVARGELKFEDGLTLGCGAGRRLMMFLRRIRPKAIQKSRSKEPAMNGLRRVARTISFRRYQIL